MRIIDTHHHFWHYNTEEFDWIDDSMSTIRRSFLPADLKETLNAAGVEGAISVQARQIIEETTQLLDFAGDNDFLKAVTGWLPLADQNIGDLLDKYSRYQKFKAVRHVVQGEPDDNFILGKAFNNGIAQLEKFGLIYEILILEKHLPQTIQFVDQHPNTTFVLDHIAKPKIGENELSPWRENIIELAKRPNVSCKVSGMVTEADFNNWTPDQLQPYFDTVLEAFGPNRLLYGSDWPVCLVATGYQQWVQVVKNAFSTLSETEQAAIFHQNAERIYKL